MLAEGAVTEVFAWLSALGVSPAEQFGGFRLAAAERAKSCVEVRFARGEGEREGETVVVRVSQRAVAGKAFARTPSFDFAHGPVPEATMAATIALLKSLVAVVGQKDPGGLELPPFVEPVPAAPMVVADEPPPVPRAPVVSAPFPTTPRDFIFADVDASDLGAYSDAMHDMFRRKLDVMIIRNVFSKECMAAIAAALERPDAGYSFLDNTQNDEQDHPQPYNLGQVLIPTRTHTAGVPLESYFERAKQFRSTCAELFARHAAPEFEARVEGVLHGVSGGRKVSIPRGPDGDEYTPATIRAIPTGAELAVHVGNYFKDSDAYWHLRTLVELEDQLSYFVPIATPDQGGEIEVYALEWQHRPKTSRGDLDVEAIARLSPSVKYHPGAGDMFLFDGGRYYHRVCRVGGPRTRWTIGGFVTLSKDHREFYYWS